MSAIVFVVEKALGGGFTARALGESIFTEANTKYDLEQHVRDAVRCHFDKGKAPQLIQLHYLADESSELIRAN